MIHLIILVEVASDVDITLLYPLISHPSCRMEVHMLQDLKRTVKGACGLYPR